MVVFVVDEDVGVADDDEEDVPFFAAVVKKTDVAPNKLAVVGMCSEFMLVMMATRTLSDKSKCKLWYIQTVCNNVVQLK